MALSSKPELDGVGIKLLNNENEKQNQFAKDFVPLALPSNICNEISNVLKIVPFRLEMNNRKMYLSMKYVRKWKTYVKRKQDFFVEQRKKTLNTFFEKLEKKKSNINQAKDYTSRAKSQVKDYKTYQQRYKVQKHIIALQKAKLEEQNRIIEELKYNKILEASRQSVDEMREEVRKSYFEIDRQLKPKIKCLTNELKIPEVDESSLVLHCLKVPQFLQRMEKRAREREEKHAMIRERRKQMEEDRIRLKQQEELSKAEMDKEEKLRRITELREKRKKDKIESIRRKQYTERMRALRVMADLHYERYLMVNYAIRPLKKLLEIKRYNVEMAESHYNFQLKKNVFLNFMWYTEDMVFERNYVAQNFYRKKVLRKYFEGFKKNHYEFVLKMQVAVDYYDYYVTNFMFRKFKEGINVLRKEFEIKVQRADAYYESNLLFKTFTCWRTLPALNALKREQEARKAKWRQKVLQVVPDYTPPDD